MHTKEWNKSAMMRHFCNIASRKKIGRYLKKNSLWKVCTLKTALGHGEASLSLRRRQIPILIILWVMKKTSTFGMTNNTLLDLL